MSRGASLSVLGLYNFDSSLFDEMAYPSGFTSEEKQTVVGNILMECAELEFLFPDFTAAKQAIGIWSRLNVAVWERIFTAANLEYTLSVSDATHKATRLTVTLKGKCEVISTSQRVTVDTSLGDTEINVDVAFAHGRKFEVKYR